MQFYMTITRVQGFSGCLPCHDINCASCDRCSIGHIRLSVSAVNHKYELSGITHVTPLRKYGKHSTGPSTYGPWVRTYSKLFSCKSVLVICSYRAQSNEIFMYWRVSSGSLPRIRRCGLLYLRTVEYDHCQHWYRDRDNTPFPGLDAAKYFVCFVSCIENYRFEQMLTCFFFQIHVCIYR